MKASPSTFRLFNSHALAVTEGILSGPNSILPPNIQELVRGVILVRSKAAPFKNLCDFQVHFAYGLYPYPLEKLTEVPCLGLGALSDSNPSVAVLRSVVATAYQVAALSQACLASCLERLRTLRVLHPVDPGICYSDDYGCPDKFIRAFDREYPGAPAKMADAGQPSWVEEMRVVRAIWIMQVVGEMRCFCQDKTNAIDWPDEDVSRLNDAELVELSCVHGIKNEGEDIRLVMAYLTTLGETRNGAYYRLPRPPLALPGTRWTTALPIPENTTWVAHAYYRDKQFHYLNPDSPLPADVRPLKAPGYSDHHKWRKAESALRRESFGAIFFRSLRGDRLALESPIAGVKFDSFRPLGFAFWDQYRMHLLGLAPHIDRIDPDLYFFAWESILPLDEVESIKSALREKWRRAVAQHESRVAEFFASQS